MSAAKIDKTTGKLSAGLPALSAREWPQVLSQFCARLSLAEQRRIVDWNATTHIWPDDPCLHELVEAQALRTPDAPAVICGDEVLTYAQLSCSARHIATQLLAAGATAREPIGLVADCSQHAIIGLLGILKAGCAYLPLDATLPDERWRYFLNDAAVRFVVGDVATRDWLRESGLTVIGSRQSLSADLIDLPKVAADSLAYVLYTSGSTGKAKGVMLDHRGPVNTVRDINHRLGIGPGDRVLALSSLGFDLSVYDLFGTLTVGGAVVQPTPAQARDPEQWAKLIHQHQVTVWNTVPALMDMLVTFHHDRQQFPSLRWIMLSGDWIPVSLPDRIWAIAPQAHQVALGGSTEASIWSVIYPYDKVDSQWRSIPYGFPMLNQRCYVVDTDLKLCPVGEVGELCLAGVGVAQGYMNRAELSAERFIRDPFDPTSRLYRTGDLCRYLPDGSLEFLGRRDHQVKIRGFRIGLGEIESEISRLPTVREAAVVVSEETPGARLIAYVALQADTTLNLEMLNSQLRQTLPEYMLPAALVQLPALPLSPNGKIDRRQLPLPCAERTPRQLPTTPTESMVSDILCRLLRVECIDVGDDFYALGGNSLSAVALISKIREVCGIELSVPELLRTSFSTRELAQRIDAMLSAGNYAGVERWPSIQCQPVTRAALSYAQQQMWVVNFLEDQRKRYVVPLVYDLQAMTPPDSKQSVSGLSLAALQFAVDRLVERHDILRTVYIATGASLQQIVLPAASIPIRQVDLRVAPTDVDDVPSQEARFCAEALEMVTAPFDLQQEWPIRVALYQMADNQWKLVFAVHHIAIDGISVNLLQRELAEHYAAYEVAGSLSCSPLRHQYANYALWQHVAMPPSSFDRDRQYWREQLKGPLPVLEVVEDRGQAIAVEGETHHFQIDGALFGSLNRLANEHRTTPFITLLALIKALLHRYSGQTDIIVGTTVSTREESVAPDLIGYFINVLPLRTQFTADSCFGKLLAGVRDTVLGALAHRHYPLELLKREILTGEAAGQDPFRVMFVLEDEPDMLQLPGLVCKAEAFDTQTAKFDLLIAAFASAEKIRFELQYRCACFDRRRIVKLGEHLQALLSAVANASDRPLNQMQWLPGPDRSVCRGTTTAAPSSFLQLFRRQVQQSPAAVAVRWHDQHLTYAQLDQRSSYLAQRLRQGSCHVGANNVVAIHLPRSLDMVMAVIAVLKAGATYVPIDPAWPAKRREQVLSDCCPRLVLSYSQMGPLSIQAGIELPHLNCDQIDYPTVDQQLVNTQIVDVLTIQDAASVADGQAGCDPERLAYILYTSGSTGKPKGVAMRHAALDNLIAWQLNHSQAGPRTRTLQFASLGFDVSFQEIFATLCSGGELMVIEEQQQSDLNQLWKFIVAERIERLFLPYVALRGLCEIAGQSAHKAALREVITAGEQLQITPSLRAFFEQLPDCQLWNHYGPTESHVVTAFPLSVDPSSWSGSPPIGTPLDNCELAILDPSQRPVPRGCHGEIYLGGQCLAAGYYNNRGLTAERFVEAEIEPGRAQAWYRTGDLGWLDWNGQLHFLGRNDHQVKVRGHRVELGEIELALAQCAGIQQAIVSLQRCGQTSYLRAHLLSDGSPLDIAAIQSQLSSRLPAYMIPQQFSLVTQLPLTVTGKVDRVKLTRLVSSELTCSETPAVSDSEIDDPVIERLKSIWKTVLSVEQLHADSNFFDCGGDSLAAAILFARLETQFGKSISISTLVERPTLRKLAEVYRHNARAPVQSWNKLAPLQPHGKQTPIVCLPGIDGHFLNFRHMIGLLGSDRPLWGLQPVGLNGVERPLSEITDIAADHVQTLRQAMPNGPYNLVGFSFGGVVAYEMSQLLRRAGQTVSLALIDCSTGLSMQPSALQSLAFHFRYATQLPDGRRLHYFLERLRGFWLGMQFKLKLIDWEQRLAGLLDVQGNYAHVASVNMRALARYRPNRAMGPAVLYRAKLRANWPGRDRTDPAASWSPLFEGGALQVIDIDGAHANILNRPNVERLVEHLGEILY